jgi:hypothetical protein
MKIALSLSSTFVSHHTSKEFPNLYKNEQGYLALDEVPSQENLITLFTKKKNLDFSPLLGNSGV